jgi:hypothetical protein
MTRDEYADKVAEVIHATYPEASVRVIETPPTSQAFFEGRDEWPSALRIEITFASILPINDDLLDDDDASRAFVPHVGEAVAHYLRTMLDEPAIRELVILAGVLFIASTVTRFEQ